MDAMVGGSLAKIPQVGVAATRQTKAGGGSREGSLFSFQSLVALFLSHPEYLQVGGTSSEEGEEVGTVDVPSSGILPSGLDAGDNRGAESIHTGLLSAEGEVPPGFSQVIGGKQLSGNEAGLFSGMKTPGNPTEEGAGPRGAAIGDWGSPDTCIGRGATLGKEALLRGTLGEGFTQGATSSLSERGHAVVRFPANLRVVGKEESIQLNQAWGVRDEPVTPTQSVLEAQAGVGPFPGRETEKDSQPKATAMLETAGSELPLGGKNPPGERREEKEIPSVFGQDVKGLPWPKPDMKGFLSEPRFSMRNPDSATRVVSERAQENLPKTVELRLDPPELGKVTVLLSARGEEVRVKFWTSGAPAQRFISESWQDLSSALAEKGLVLSGFLVDQGNSFERKNLNLDRKGSGWHRRAAPVDEDMVFTGSLNLATRSRFDYLA